MMVLLTGRTTSSEAGIPFALDSEVVRGLIEASQPLLLPIMQQSRQHLMSSACRSLPVRSIRCGRPKLVSQISLSNRATPIGSPENLSHTNC